MSRIGKLPIFIPENVTLNYTGNNITVKGKFGTLTTEIPEIINLTSKNQILKLTVNTRTKNGRNLCI